MTAALDVSSRTVLPVPPGRGRWRLTLHNRAFINQRPSETGIGELVDAHSRRLEKKWNGPSTLTFSVDGHSQAAALIRELHTDVIAWRWDAEGGRSDQMTFRGPVTTSEDILSEQAHTVNYQAVDYGALLTRRYYTATTPVTYTQADQDTIVGALVAIAGGSTSAGTSLAPGGYLPLQVLRVNPDQTSRAVNSGQIRDRTYYGGQEIGAAISNLAAVIGGFDWDVFPGSDGLAGQPWNYPAADLLRVFYPAQGVTRSDMALVYGGSGIGGIASATRTVNSGKYANYVRVLGNNDATADDPQLIGEAWNADASAGQAGAIGLWMLHQDASDVTVQSTLDEKAAGDLEFYSTLIPTYSLRLAPGAYAYGYPNMGDTVPLIIRSGRLNVNTTVRVLGIAFDIGDDGQEDVELTVGRPAVTLASLLADTGRRIDALARR